jgi:hypothetical protein
MGCGAAMRLVAVVSDQELMTPGYAHHTFECPDCRERETRLAFSREPAPPMPEPNPQEEGRFTARRAWDHAVAKLRIMQSVLSEQAQAAKHFERKVQFDLQWENLVPAAGKPDPKPAIVGAQPRSRKSAAMRRPVGSLLWATAVAKLRASEDRSEG